MRKHKLFFKRELKKLEALAEEMEYQYNKIVDYWTKLEGHDCDFYEVMNESAGASIVSHRMYVKRNDRYEVDAWLTCDKFKKERTKNIFESFQECVYLDLSHVGPGYGNEGLGFYPISPYRFYEVLFNNLEQWEKENASFDYYDPEYRKLRLQVFLRDGEVCAKCGATPKPGTSLTIDHIKPVSKHPELVKDLDNLQVLCWECNQEKSNKNQMDYREKNET